MKKFLALILALVLALSALAGCSKNETAGGSGPDKERPTPSAPKDRPTSPKPDETLPETEPQATEPAETEPAETAPASGPAVSGVGFDGVVVYSENDIIVTATGSVFDGGIPAVSFTLENNSKKNIIVNSGNFLVNNLLSMYGSLYLNAAAGETVSNVLYLDEKQVALSGLEELVSIAGYVQILNGDNYDEIDRFIMNLSSEEAETYEQPADLSVGITLFDQDGITIYARSIEEISGGPRLELLVMNTTEMDVYLLTEAVDVDGTTMDSWAYEYVFPGSICYYTLDVDPEQMEAAGITYESMASMVFSAQIYDAINYDLILETGDMEVTFINE